MNDLFQTIEDLSREQALEACQFIALQILQNNKPGKREEKLLKPVLDQPYKNIQEIEELSRLLLLTAASDPENKKAIESAIEGAGKKQVILGGPEIVALALIGLLALQALLTKGKRSQIEVIRIEEKDGNTRVVIENKITYGISNGLGQILKNYFVSDREKD